MKLIYENEIEHQEHLAQRRAHRLANLERLRAREKAWRASASGKASVTAKNLRDKAKLARLKATATPDELRQQALDALRQEAADRIELSGCFTPIAKLRTFVVTVTERL